MTETHEAAGTRSGIFFAAVLAIFLFGLGLVIAFVDLPFAIRDPAPTGRADAYRRGGRPIHDARVRHAIAVLLPKLSAAASAEAMRGVAFAPELARIRRELGDAALVSALGADASAAMRALASVYADQVEGRTDFEAVRAATLRVDAALVARGLGYRIEAVDRGTTTIDLLGFEVDEVRKRRVGESDVLLLLATRLDALEADPFAFAWVSADSDVLLVSVDRAERLARELGDASARDSLIVAGSNGLAQRYVDLRREHPLPLPSSLLAFHRPSLVQGPRQATLNGITLAVRESLAAIAAEPSTSDLVRRVLLRCVTVEGRCDRDHENSARIVLAEVARQLAIPDVREPQFLGAEDLVRLDAALARREDPAVAQAAGDAFERLFGDRPSELR